MMWKWFGGCAVVILILIISGGVWTYHRYEKFTAQGGSATIAVHAPLPRVFAALANGDSLSGWASDRSPIIDTRHGLLRVGDTLRVPNGQMTISTSVDSIGSAPTRRARVSDDSADGGPQNLTWIVTDVQPDRILAVELRNERNGKVVAVRRDSLVSSGDSTLIICTVASPAIDSALSAHDTSRKAGRAMIDVGAKLMVSTLRLQAEVELKRLKAHIEGGR